MQISLRGRYSPEEDEEVSSIDTLGNGAPAFRMARIRRGLVNSRMAQGRIHAAGGSNEDNDATVDMSKEPGSTDY